MIPENGLTNFLQLYPVGFAEYTYLNIKIHKNVHWMVG